MEVESSNDVMITNVKNSKETERRPIASLLKRLILNDKEQNTMLTNTQLIEILQLEFNINIAEVHELEVDIYLSVIKRFLLDWPQWDEFDKEVTRLKKINARHMIDLILEEKYLKLKEYLKVMVDVAKDKAQSLIKSIVCSPEPSVNDKETKKTEKENVVMEMFCRRAQLNDIIFRYPLDYQNNTIFNPASSIPNTISIKMYDIETVFRYFHVSISVIMKDLSFTYQMNPNLQHAIINKKHSQHAYEKTKLNDDMQKRIDKKTKKSVTVRDVYRMMNRGVFPCHKNNLQELIEVLAKVFLIDFSDYECVEVPGRYRRNISTYPYVRYLYAEQPAPLASSKYDLQLEELVTPSVMYGFTYVETADIDTRPVPEKFISLTIRCLVCSVKGKEFEVEDMVNHFNDVHRSEKELICTNCMYKLDVFDIGQKGWYHDC